MKQLINLNNKNIRDFDISDTLYISKIEAGFQVIYFCTFESFKKGIVVGKYINAEPSWAHYNSAIGRRITARLKNCFMWGEDKASHRLRCHWFGKSGYAE